MSVAIEMTRYMRDFASQSSMIGAEDLPAFSAVSHRIRGKCPDWRFQARHLLHILNVIVAESFTTPHHYCPMCVQPPSVLTVTLRLGLFKRSLHRLHDDVLPAHLVAPAALDGGIVVVQIVELDLHHLNVRIVGEDLLQYLVYSTSDLLSLLPACRRLLLKLYRIPPGAVMLFPRKCCISHTNVVSFPQKHLSAGKGAPRHGTHRPPLPCPRWL